MVTDRTCPPSDSDPDKDADSGEIVKDSGPAPRGSIPRAAWDGNTGTLPARLRCTGMSNKRSCNCSTRPRADRRILFGHPSRLRGIGATTTPVTRKPKAQPCATWTVTLSMAARSGGVTTIHSTSPPANASDMVFARRARGVSAADTCNSAEKEQASDTNSGTGPSMTTTVGSTRVFATSKAASSMAVRRTDAIAPARSPLTLDAPVTQNDSENSATRG